MTIKDPAGPSRGPNSPPPPVYLAQGYSSSVKGGTVIAGEVLDREEHARRMLDPETYRPAPCVRCGHRMLGHGTRPRKPVGETPVDIRRYTCPSCGGAVQGQCPEIC